MDATGMHSFTPCFFRPAFQKIAGKKSLTGNFLSALLTHIFNMCGNFLK
jgi:hypothetical protein